MAGQHTARVPASCITIARLSDPPDTSLLERCSAAETERAKNIMSARLLRRRHLLGARGATRASIERVLGALRRLHNPQLRAYACPRGIVLCEPFGARRSVVARASVDQAGHLVTALLGRPAPRELVAALAPFGRTALARVVDSGVRARIVPKNRSFSRCSRSVAALVPDIDRWQAPPAGLFVLEERLLLLRPHALRMAAAHEFGHALDAVLAERPCSYFSFESMTVREAFRCTTGFVNEYAASGLDEYFAESLRAYVEVNDERSTWSPLTRQTLFERDPRMFAIVERLLCGLKQSAVDGRPG